MDTAQEKEERRAPVEAEFADAREDIEKQYVADKNALEQTYLSDLRDNEEARQQALVGAGLNPDGSDPQER